ncbi:hypothetical protein CDAR_566931 [Caerostris darwini]|uniref:Uncharacterized protein n=1 Tax=Caerostris darwini TaxID=1538125 RepID=A0AAV4PLX4_9ARAC|nr:hypothetical protein CDAR_566931 [Caerostris darwini]
MHPLTWHRQPNCFLKSGHNHQAHEKAIPSYLITFSLETRELLLRTRCQTICRFAFHQDCGPIVRVVFIQITHFLKSTFGMAARWREGVRVGHVEQVATDLLSKEIY